MTTAIATIPNLPQIEGANLLNLMIVDDERAIREVCRDVAQTLGFHTSIADSAEHAYRVLESNAIDVVLLDLKLPGAGGLEARTRFGSDDPTSSSLSSLATAQFNPRCRP